MIQFVKSINPGRLNKRVTIYSYMETETALGASKTVLKKAASVWAEVKPVRGSEFLEYYREANALQFKVTMRWRPGLTEKDVLVFQGRQFEINSIINIMEAKTYLEVYCTESRDKRILEEVEDGGEN
jgi:SPP1 family predicted phage head-tail adaptor